MFIRGIGLGREKKRKDPGTGGVGMRRAFLRVKEKKLELLLGCLGLWEKMDEKKFWGNFVVYRKCNPLWPSTQENFKSILLFFWKDFHKVEVGLRQEQEDLVLFITLRLLPAFSMGVCLCVCISECVHVYAKHLKKTLWTTSNISPNVLHRIHSQASVLHLQLLPWQVYTDILFICKTQHASN